MKKKRQRHGAEIKAKVAIEAIRGVKTINQIAENFGVHPVVVGQWKKQAVDDMAEVFSKERDTDHAEFERREAELYQQIGRLKVELDWLKKKSGLVGRGQA